MDVCKRFLDLHLDPTGENWRVANTIVGLLLVRSQFPAPVQRIVLESTGGYDKKLQVSGNGRSREEFLIGSMPAHGLVRS